MILEHNDINALKTGFLKTLSNHEDISSYLEDKSFIGAIKDDKDFIHLSFLTCIHCYKTKTISTPHGLGMQILQIPITFLEQFHQTLVNNNVIIPHHILMKAFNFACYGENIDALTFLQKNFDIVNLVVKQPNSSLTMKDVDALINQNTIHERDNSFGKLSSFSYDRQVAAIGNYHGFLTACNNNTSSAFKSDIIINFFLDNASYIATELLEIAIVSAIKANNAELSLKLTERSLTSSHQTNYVMFSNVELYKKILQDTKQEKLLDSISLTIKLFNEEQKNNGHNTKKKI